MTMIVGCHFSDGAVLLADSRATWTLGTGRNTYQDTLQKIFPLADNVSIGFAGHVATATKILQAVHNRTTKKPRLKHIANLGPNLGRFAKHEFRMLTGKGKRAEYNSLVLAGLQKHRGNTNSPDIHLWVYESPQYRPVRIEHGFIAMGSGAEIAAPYLKTNWDGLMAQPGGLKGKADWLISRLESELERVGDIYVGGLFQVLIIDTSGIRPMNYGRFSLDPDDEDEPVRMTISKGVWTQANLRTGAAVALHGPSGLTTPPSAPIQVRTYPGKQKILRHYPESFLTYFVPCIAVHEGPGVALFRGIANCFAAEDFPIKARLLGCLAVHPEPGKHNLLLKFVSESIETIYEETVEAIYPLQEIRRHPEIQIEVPHAGNYFLELWLDTYRLARKPLLFRKMIQDLIDDKAPEGPTPELQERQKALLLEEQEKQSDPELTSGSAILSYLIPCGKTQVMESEMSFEGIGQTVYPPKFPAQMRYQLAIGFRVKPASYRLRVDLIEAASRTVIPVTTATIEALHEFRDVQVQGEITLAFPRQGIYVLDVYLNDHRIGRTHFVADDINAPMAYQLHSQQIDRIRAGETLVLVRDSVHVPGAFEEETNFT